jgi:hypothetical protein
MRYLMLIQEQPGHDAGAPPAALYDAVKALRADTTLGRWLDDGGLASPEDALWVRTADGRSTTLDGPFAETKEVIGGFFVIESPSREAMTQWVEAFTALHARHWPEMSYTAQVRQIVDPPPIA